MSDEERVVKKRWSTYLPTDLIERARAAVYWTRNVPGEPSTYAQLDERALRAEVERLERIYNHGHPFVIPDGEGLRPGPAPGVMEEVARMRKAAREAQDRVPIDEENGGTA